MVDAEVAVLPAPSVDVDNTLTDVPLKTDVVEVEAAIVDLNLAEVAVAVAAQVIQAQEKSGIKGIGAPQSDVILEVVEDEDDDEFISKGPPDWPERQVSRQDEPKRILKPDTAAPAVSTNTPAAQGQATATDPKKTTIVDPKKRIIKK